MKIAGERQAAIEIDLLLRIGDAFYALGDMMESARALETAAARAGAADLKLEQVHALNALARTTVFMDADRGLEACQRALQACDGLEDPLLLGRTKLVAATLRIGYDRWTRDDDETCVAARQTIAQLSDPSAPSYHEIWDAHRQALKGTLRAKGIAFAGSTPILIPKTTVATLVRDRIRVQAKCLVEKTNGKARRKSRLGLPTTRCKLAPAW